MTHLPDSGAYAHQLEPSNHGEALALISLTEKAAQAWPFRVATNSLIRSSISRHRQFD
jgi:hypothetical protein